MNLSPDGGTTPAPRREGDVAAMNAAYNRGPVLRRRHRHPADRLAALPRGRARHAQQPPVVRLAAADARPRRRRLQPGDLVHGRAPARQSDPTPQAFEVIDEWMANIRANPDAERGRQQAGAGDRPLLHDRGHRDRARRGRLGRHPRQTGPRAPARRSSRSTRPRASWPAARCAAASTSARCSRSRTRSRGGVYGSWTPRRPRSRG